MPKRDRKKPRLSTKEAAAAARARRLAFEAQNPIEDVLARNDLTLYEGAFNPETGGLSREAIEDLLARFNPEAVPRPGRPVDPAAVDKALQEALAARGDVAGVGEAALPGEMAEGTASVLRKGYFGKAAPKGLLGRISSKIGPRALGAAGAVALPFALEYAPDLVRGVRQTGSEMFSKRSVTDRALDRMLEAQGRVRDYQRYRMRKEQELQRLQRVNTERLATLAPHLFNQIMAGRELPEDAVVIGGQPRTDILQEVTRQMSQGRFTPPEGVGDGF